MIKEKLTKIIQEAVDKICSGESPIVLLEAPTNPDYGDFATNAAMMLTKALRKKPQLIAQEIQESIKDKEGLIESISIAGPGFINFKIKSFYWIDLLQEISNLKQEFGICEKNKGKKVLIEFVSANPTGPLHIGHGRGAVVGDTLANLFQAVGYLVQREYYVNDGGFQISTLGKSVEARLKEHWGEKINFPEDGYQGEYLKELAQKLVDRKKEFEAWEKEKLIDYLGKWAGEEILNEIKNDLKQVGIVFDNYFFESTLYQKGEVDKILLALKNKGLSYDKEGALWLASTRFGDDKDRVLIKSDKSYTYLTPDIAYHEDKYRRGYDVLINIWGADHGGYGERLKASLKGLGLDIEKLKIIYIQMVNLIRGGEMISMSTRRAQYETLNSVASEVGADAARYFFMMRSCQAQLDFDVDLAKKQTAENPVYYIQYAHARICSIFAKAEEEGMKVEQLFSYKKEYASILDLPEEIGLAKFLLDYPDVIQKAADELAPHRVSFYLLELTRKFQAYYDKARSDQRYRVVSTDKQITEAKLYLLSCVKQVLWNGLSLLGVSAPERM